MADLKTLKGVAEKDRKMIEDAEALLGPEPSIDGVRQEPVLGPPPRGTGLPLPAAPTPTRTRAATNSWRALDAYLENEHPSIQIDQEQEIPRWVIDRLFELGVLGMTIPREYGGGGLGITSYNRVLERIGRSCGSTAVMVSAHQSIGCKAIMLFGTEEQKRRWLPHLAKDWLSAFCLSEPNVGCDAGGQETRCRALGGRAALHPQRREEVVHVRRALRPVHGDGQAEADRSEDRQDEREGHRPGLHARHARHRHLPEEPLQVRHPRHLAGPHPLSRREGAASPPAAPGGQGAERRPVLPELRPLHALGRHARRGDAAPSSSPPSGRRPASSSSARWPTSSWCRRRSPAWPRYTYAMDAVLYLTTGMLDRHDEDIMLETAVCKLFCSEMGWRVVNDAMQIMGGEGYMTENEIERIFRDSRINLIVEGANEVMQSFIFAYGGKQLAEKMLGVQQAVGWDHHDSPTHNLARILRGLKHPAVVKAAAPLGAELFLGVRPAAPQITRRRRVAARAAPTGCASWCGSTATSSSGPAGTTASRSSPGRRCRRGWRTAPCGCTPGRAR